MRSSNKKDSFFVIAILILCVFSSAHAVGLTVRFGGGLLYDDRAFNGTLGGSQLALEMRLNRIPLAFQLATEYWNKGSLQYPYEIETYDAAKVLLFGYIEDIMPFLFAKPLTTKTTYLYVGAGAGIISVPKIEEPDERETGIAYDAVCGTAEFDVCFVKTDSLGNIVWRKPYGGTGFEEGTSFQMDTDGEYIITGFTTSFGAGGMDVYLIKTAPWGDTLWTKTYGGSQDEYGSSVQVTADGGYIITGYSNSFGLDYQILLIRTDAMGDTMWVKTYGGPGEDIGISLLVTADGSFVIVGITDSYGAGGRDVYLIKTDSLGNLLWETTFGGTEDDVGVSIRETFNGGYVVAGHTESFGAGSHDLWLLKIEPEVGVEERNTIVKSITSGTIFSGPLQLPEGKDYQIFDITGRAVISAKIKPGIYFIEVDGKITKKVVKVR